MIVDVDQAFLNVTQLSVSISVSICQGWCILIWRPFVRLGVFRWNSEQDLKQNGKTGLVFFTKWPQFSLGAFLLLYQYKIKEQGCKKW